MKIIASTGVKGGVGKTTFAVLYALKLAKEGKKVVLCDCDVECPNICLLLNQKLENPEPIYQSIPKLNESKCKKCGTCSQVCREHAIFWIKGKYPQFIYDLCTGCMACFYACPFNAIEKDKKLVGETFVSKVKDNLWLVTGRSEIGIAETGPIVRETKERAIELAKKINADYLIIDTAPGAHCNVAQALIGCDKIYAVTEPTPLGAYALQTILELAQKMGIQAEVVLNKAGVGNKRIIEEVAQKFETRIVIEIPYSEELVRAYCRGELEKMVNLV